MSSVDVIGLGPFLKALGERLERMTKEVRRDYSRRPSFRREIEALVCADE